MQSCAYVHKAVECIGRNPTATRVCSVVRLPPNGRTRPVRQAEQTLRFCAQIRVVSPPEPDAPGIELDTTFDVIVELTVLALEFVEAILHNVADTDDAGH
jgi:hypothetical protein